MSQERDQLITGSAEFMERLGADIAGAQIEILVQCMSFEADSAGRKLIDLLAAKPNLRRVLLIDSYSKAVVNDTLLHRPGISRRFRNAWRERAALDILLKRATENGIEVRFTEPLGFLNWRYALRNHKKLILIDDYISYVGGRNFTEHNLDWQDLMVRHHHTGIHHELRRGFMGDLAGAVSEYAVGPRAGTVSGPLRDHVRLNDALQLYHLDGRRSRGSYATLLERVTQARSLTIVSPYISGPFLNAAMQVPELTLILPARNNKWMAELALKYTVSRRSSRHRIVRVPGQMIHAKFMILDNAEVVYGSSNFDLVSYHFEKEILLARRDPDLVGQFTLLVDRLLDAATPVLTSS